MDGKQLHQEALVIDSHNDSIVTHISAGLTSFSGASWPARRAERTSAAAGAAGALVVGSGADAASAAAWARPFTL